MKTAAVQAGAALRFDFFPRCRFLLCGESEHHRAVGLLDAADDGGPELAFDRFVPLAACLSASSEGVVPCSAQVSGAPVQMLKEIKVRDRLLITAGALIAVRDGFGHKRLQRAVVMTGGGRIHRAAPGRGLSSVSTARRRLDAVLWAYTV